MKALFLGAGASYECGMPLVWEFTNVLRANVLKRLDTKLFNLHGHSDFRQEFEAILSDPNIHYEQMVGKLEGIQLQMREDSGIVSETARQFLDCVQVLLLEDQILTTRLLAEKAKDYSGLKSLLKQYECLHVFSLNHDVNFEEICKLHGVAFRDGFYEGGADRYSNIANFKSLTIEQIDNRALNYFGAEGYGVNLLKLHGSLDIFAVEDKNLYLKCAPPLASPVGLHVQEIQRLEQHSIKVSQQANLRTIGELDVLDVHGEIQFLRRSLLSGAHKFKGTFDQVAPQAFFDEFKARIQVMTEIDVIGYGFGDDHVNEVLNDWLHIPKVHMNIYDPYRKSVPPSLEFAVDNISIFNIGLTEYFAQFEAPKYPSVSYARNKMFQQGREDLQGRRIEAWNIDGARS